MATRTDEIADGIYRISTFLPDVAPPAGFTMNQFLIDADEPLLFHCGFRQMFPLVSEAVGRILPVERLRWIMFGHVEADECGSMNEWLAAAPQAEVAHGELGVEVSLSDLADRPPRALTDDEMLDLGGKRVRHLATPHVPHNWEAQAMFEETTGTLFCGDVGSQLGGHDPLTVDDIVGPAMEAEDMFRGTALTPATGATIRRFAELEPRTMAIMHGSSYSGDCVAALETLAAGYDERVEQAAASA
ncbi:MAG: MBL fold metallo-hydrolase [Acidimicrobiia bacterium]